MLKERRELLDYEIAKLTKECSETYLLTVRNFIDPYQLGSYRDNFARLMQLKGELEIVVQLIEDGHE